MQCLICKQPGRGKQKVASGAYLKSIKLNASEQLCGEGEPESGWPQAQEANDMEVKGKVRERT